MRRRNRHGLLIWMLTAIWLCVQSPWAHAARMEARRDAVQTAMEHAPCHGMEHQPAAVDPAPADSAGCCTDGHCDGHCAHLVWVPLAAAWQFAGSNPQPVAQAVSAGAQVSRQPELFRPPI